MIGLTHEEVKNLIKDCKDKDELQKIILENYDGYLFTSELKDKDKTLNTALVMYLLSYYKEYKRISDSYYDDNIIVNYNKIDCLLKLQCNNFHYEIIEKILKDKKIEGILIKEFNLFEDITRDTIISLLYYFGCLTIQSKSFCSNHITFKVPNRVMLEVYSDYFVQMLREQNIFIR